MQNKIENLEIFSNATINIRVLNMHFTVLGEVNPGKFYFDQNNKYIWFRYCRRFKYKWQRSQVRLIRGVEGKSKIFNVDLTKPNIMRVKHFRYTRGYNNY